MKYRCNDVLFSSQSAYLSFFVFLPAQEMAGRSSSRASGLLDRLDTSPERSGPKSPDPLESSLTEIFISEENISKMEKILDTWSNTLKVSLLPHPLLPQSINLMALICCLLDSCPQIMLYGYI